MYFFICFVFSKISIICVCVCFKDSFIYFKVRVNGDKKKERETEFFHQLIHSPNGCTGQGWTRRRTGTSNSIWTSHLSSRGPYILTMLCGFPRCISRALNWKRSSRDSSGNLYIGVVGSNLTHATMTSMYFVHT